MGEFTDRWTKHRMMDGEACCGRRWKSTDQILREIDDTRGPVGLDLQGHGAKSVLF